MFTEAISGTSSPRSQFRFWNTFRPSLRLKLGNLASKSGIDLFGVIKASKHYMLIFSKLTAERCGSAAWRVRGEYLRRKAYQNARENLKNRRLAKSAATGCWAATVL